MTDDLHRAVLPRAPRFDLALAVHYRRHRARHWSDGMSINVSRTGVLFTTCAPPPSCGDRIDFFIQLPTPAGTPGCDARCTGRVVRIVPPGTKREMPAVAVTIDHYVLERESARSTRWAAPGRSRASSR